MKFLFGDIVVVEEGMGGYNFTEFYKKTENRYDLQVQVNAIKYLNMLIDEKILGL